MFGISLLRGETGKNPETEFTGAGSYENLMLIFSDDGKGFPEAFDFENAESLGLQLVNALVDQTEGSLDLNRENGTKFTIKFRDIIRRDNLKNEHV